MPSRLARILPLVVPALGVLLAITSWFELDDAGLSTPLLALALCAPLSLLAYPLTPRIAPLVAIWIVAFVANNGIEIVEQRWDSSGALFWVSMVAAAWSVASASRRVALGEWVAYVLAGATALGSTPGTSFQAELFWLGAIGGGVFLGGRFLARYRAQAITLRAQALLLEHEREEHARLAAAEERARIARELHDVVAHSVSVMVMHAGAVRRLLLDSQVEERAALEALEQTGRDSMSEIRRALGVLRHPDEPAERAPQQGIRDLEQLVAQLRGAGLRVELVVSGQRRDVASGVDMAAYRIAQEALTNVVKHAADARVQVRVRYGAYTVEVEVVDDGRGGSTSELPSGYGLVGLRERASVLGGTLEAGERPGGGFRVQARLPLEPVA